MEKVIKDGKVAILVSDDFGAGWSTWNSEFPELLYHPKVVEMVINGRQSEIDEEWVTQNLGENYAYVYCGSATRNLKVIWLPIGTKFFIYDYDGAEILVTEDEFMEA